MTTEETQWKMETAFPVGRSRLAVLLFVSTEVMFFAALVGSYLVLRISQGNHWPSRHDVHLNLGWGIINTVVLLLSTVTLGMAIRGARRNTSAAARMWLLLTVGLGASFLGIKFYEYRVKFQQGIFPSTGGWTVYDQADESYLSRTVQVMQQEIDRVELRESASPLGIDYEQWLSRLYLIQAGIVDWTRFQGSRSGKPEVRLRSIECLAHQVYPLANPLPDKDYLRIERNGIERDIREYSQQLGQTEEQLTLAQQEIKRLLPLRPEEGGPVREQFDQVSQKAQSLTENMTRLQKELKPLHDRLRALDQLDVADGLNEAYALKLPIVIPGGRPWASSYYLLTGFHAVHLLAGLMVLSVWIGMRMDASRVCWLQNFACYWYFVKVVWLMIFVTIYLT